MTSHMEYLIGRVKAEQAARENYFMQLEIQVPTLLAIVRSLQIVQGLMRTRAPEARMPADADAIQKLDRVVCHIIGRLHADGFLYCAKFLREHDRSATDQETNV
jgi:hypothetical protein